MTPEIDRLISDLEVDAATVIAVAHSGDGDDVFAVAGALLALRDCAQATSIALRPFGTREAAALRMIVEVSIQQCSVALKALADALLGDVTLEAAGESAGVAVAYVEGLVKLHIELGFGQHGERPKN